MTMALMLAVALLLTASLARAAELPFTGIYGSTTACALFALGGKDAVWRDGLDENGAPLPVEADSEDDIFLLLEAKQLTTAGLRCSLSETKGTNAVFECDDGSTLDLVVVMRNRDNLVVDDGFGESTLRQCGAP